MSDLKKLHQRILALTAGASAAILSLAKSDDSFAPPDGVKTAAARGLELRRKWKRGGLSNEQASEQGIGSGVQRATNLSNGNRVTSRVIGQMVGFFSRHAKNYRPDETEKDGGPTAGTIAWLLWGGNAGKAWAQSVHNRLQRPVEKAEAAMPIVKVCYDGGCPCAGAVMKSVCAVEGCQDEKNGILHKSQPRHPRGSGNGGRFMPVRKEGEAAASGPTVSSVHVDGIAVVKPKKQKKTKAKEAA